MQNTMSVILIRMIFIGNNSHLISKSLPQHIYVSINVYAYKFSTYILLYILKILATFAQLSELPGMFFQQSKL